MTIDIITILLGMGLTASCIHQAHKQKQYWLRFFHMLPVIFMFICLGFYTYY